MKVLKTPAMGHTACIATHKGIRFAVRRRRRNQGFKLEIYGEVKRPIFPSVRQACLTAQRLVDKHDKRWSRAKNKLVRHLRVVEGGKGARRQA